MLTIPYIAYHLVLVRVWLSSPSPLPEGRIEKKNQNVGHDFLFLGALELPGTAALPLYPCATVMIVRTSMAPVPWVGFGVRHNPSDL